MQVLFFYHQWYPEVNHFCQGVPLVLIGCKTDLRKDKEQLRKLRASKQEPITYNQVSIIAFTVLFSLLEWRLFKCFAYLRILECLEGHHLLLHLGLLRVSPRFPFTALLVL